VYAGVFGFLFDPEDGSYIYHRTSWRYIPKTLILILIGFMVFTYGSVSMTLVVTHCNIRWIPVYRVDILPPCSGWNVNCDSMWYYVSVLRVEP
jgi:hypothetical protein